MGAGSAFTGLGAATQSTGHDLLSGSVRGDAVWTGPGRSGLAAYAECEFTLAGTRGGARAFALRNRLDQGLRYRRLRRRRLSATGGRRGVHAGWQNDQRSL